MAAPAQRNHSVGVSGYVYVTTLAVAENFGKVRHDPRRGVWFVDCRPLGRIYSVPLGRHTRIAIRTEDQARNVLAGLRHDLRDGMTPEAAVAQYLGSKALGFAQCAERFLTHFRAQVQAGERSPNSLRMLEGYARDHWRPLAEHSVLHISYGTLEDYDLQLAQRGLSGKTRKNVLGGIRSVLSWLERRGELRALPRFPSASVTARAAATIISIDTQEAILAAIPEALRGIYYAMAELALRPGEARALNVADYDAPTRRLTVAAAMKGPREDAPRRGTKTGDVRYMVASERLAEWIMRHHPPFRFISNHPLFLLGAARWDHDNLWKTWNTAAKQVGVAVSLYTGTKHCTATAMRRAGVPLDHIRQALGHTDARSTELYSHLANSAVVEAFSVVEKLRGKR